MKVASLLFLITFFISCNISNVNKDEIVAEVNGEKIYLSELSSQSKQEIFDLLNTAYEIKNRVLTNLIKQRLLENTAKNKNMSLEEFLDFLVQQKLLLDQDSIKKYYAINTESFYAKNSLIPLKKGTIEEELSFQQRLRNRIVQALVDSLYQKADIKRYIIPLNNRNVL